MNSHERLAAQMRDEVDRIVSQIMANMISAAAEPGWTEDQRLALRIVAQRLGARTAGTFAAERERLRRRRAAENLIRQLAARIVTLEQIKGNAPVLLIDERTLTAARGIVIEGENDVFTGAGG